MTQVKVEVGDGWLCRIEHATNITQGFPLSKSLSMKTWEMMLDGEHSPIRNMQVYIYLSGVKYWAANHLRTHMVAFDLYDGPARKAPLHPEDWQCWMRSQRPDSYNPVEYDRNEALQSALVDMMIRTNPNGLIDVSRDRLCYRAHEETRGIWMDVRLAITGWGNRFVQAVGERMLPNCAYRGVCPHGGCAEMSKE